MHQVGTSVAVDDIDDMEYRGGDVGLGSAVVFHSLRLIVHAVRGIGLQRRQIRCSAPSPWGRRQHTRGEFTSLGQVTEVTTIPGRAGHRGHHNPEGLTGGMSVASDSKWPSTYDGKWPPWPCRPLASQCEPSGHRAGHRRNHHPGPGRSHIVTTILEHRQTPVAGHTK